MEPFVEGLGLELELELTFHVWERESTSGARGNERDGTTATTRRIQPFLGSP